MPRLYDEVIEIANEHNDKYLDIFKTSLPYAQIFLASNVHELIDPHGVYEASKDFPNAAPPFDVTWVEWSVKKEFADSVNFSELRRCGTLTLSEYTDDGFSLYIYGIGEMFSDGHPVISVFPGKARYVLDVVGNVVNSNIIMPSDPKEVGGVIPEAIDGLMIPTLLTFSLLNCRNVTTQEHGPYRKEEERWSKRGSKRLLCRYHTLNISTMARILREEGGIKKNGPAKALHICRGHFKDYTKSGLFGKHRGLFYFGPVIRGSKNSGLVIKDYNVGV